MRIDFPEKLTLSIRHGCLFVRLMISDLCSVTNRFPIHHSTMFRPTRILLAAGIKYVPYSHIPYPQSHPSFIPSCSSTLQSQYRSSLVYSCSPRPIKFSTGITGLPPHPDPLPILRATYTSTLHLLSNLPPTSVYRQATEAITKHRLQLVEKAGEDVKAVEGELGMVEGILEEAKAEQALVGKMLEWKSWVSLLKGRGGGAGARGRRESCAWSS